jgi:hypothetical protein
MGCPYEYYKEEETYYPRLYCKIDNKLCLYQKKCLMKNRYIPIEDNLWKECYKMIEDKIKEIPQGSYYVQSYRPNRSGKLFLYVVINDHVEKIPTELTSIDQDYVYLKEGLDGYEVSLTPFRGTRKK